MTSAVVLIAYILMSYNVARLNIAFQKRTKSLHEKKLVDNDRRGAHLGNVAGDGKRDKEEEGSTGGALSERESIRQGKREEFMRRLGLDTSHAHSKEA